MQPVVIDDHGVHRFQANAIVRYLREHGGLDLNKIEIAYQTGAGCFAEDKRQFMQLLGYSVSGWRGLTDHRADGGLTFADLDPAEAAARPGNSDADCIREALRLLAMSGSCEKAVRALAGSPSGRRIYAAANETEPKP